MNQPQLFTPDFDGVTYDREKDHARLSTLLYRVEKYMSDGLWHGLSDIAFACGGSEASVSARLRDLRKPKFGSHRIVRQRVSQGLWHYRMIKP